MTSHPCARVFSSPPLSQLPRPRHGNQIVEKRFKERTRMARSGFHFSQVRVVTPNKPAASHIFLSIPNFFVGVQPIEHFPIPHPGVPRVWVRSVVGTQIAQQGGPIPALVLCPTVAKVAQVSSGRVWVLISQPSEAVPELSTQSSAFSTSRPGWAGGLGTLVRAVGG